MSNEALLTRMQRFRGALVLNFEIAVQGANSEKNRPFWQIGWAQGQTTTMANENQMPQRTTNYGIT